MSCLITSFSWSWDLVTKLPPTAPIVKILFLWRSEDAFEQMGLKTIRINWFHSCDKNRSRALEQQGPLHVSWFQVSGATGAKSKSTGSTPTRRLYHSTNEQGAKGIRKDKTIRESLDIGGDTAMGRGAYLHSLNPRKVSKQDLVRNNYDDGNRHKCVHFELHLWTIKTGRTAAFNQRPQTS